LRASIASVATATLKAAKQNKSVPKTTTAKRKRKSLSMPKPKARSDGKQKRQETNDEDNASESYHFIAYLPYKGRVWELDGLKHGPLECAEFEDQGSNWVDAVRPALSGKMAAYSAAGDIRFNLLALVKDNYQLRSDALELTRRELNALERRLTEIFDRDWKIQVRFCRFSIVVEKVADEI
jgi:ubiquitin carboxyl-terminal hydrolase L5